MKAAFAPATGVNTQYPPESDPLKNIGELLVEKPDLTKKMSVEHKPA